MRPLTEHTPKPLLSVGNHTLLDRQIEKLVAAGVKEIVINASYLGDMIEQHIGRQKIPGVDLILSREPKPLETAGAIYFARERLGYAPFLLVNGDVWMDLDYQSLLSGLSASPVEGGGHLVFVPNPPHKQYGDFSLVDGCVGMAKLGQPSYTYSGVSILSPALVTAYSRCREVFPLREAFESAIEEKKMTGEVYDGYWLDVGTPERLEALRAHVFDGET